jgi:predicted DNA-binding mobile mystery protein A
MRTPVKLLALELFDQDLPQLRDASRLLRDALPQEGWVRSLRKSLGMSMSALSRRLGFKVAASLNELEQNERSGAITLATLRRAAEALDADLVYAIVPRKNLREMVSARARVVARQSMAPISKSMAMEEQGLTPEQIERQIDELAHELERKPNSLWR